MQACVNRANPKSGPTRRGHLHDNRRVELRIRSDLSPVFVYRLLDVKRGDRTSDRGEKHPDCKVLSRANATVPDPASLRRPWEMIGLQKDFFKIF